MSHQPNPSEEWQHTVKHTLDRAAQDLSTVQIQKLRAIRTEALRQADTPFRNFFYHKSFWLPLSIASMAALILVLNMPHRSMLTPATPATTSAVALHTQSPPSADLPMLEDMPMLEALGGDHA